MGKTKTVEGLKAERRLKKPKSPEHLAIFEAFDMVRLAGFEPTTPWFVAKYSIQLSYSR